MSTELSQEVATKLTEAKITAEPYKRSPVAGSGFILNRPRNNDLIKVWKTEMADIEVHPDESKRQAVINVSEGDRELKRKSKTTVWIGSSDRTAASLHNSMKSQGISHNPFFGMGRRNSKVAIDKDELFKLYKNRKADSRYLAVPFEHTFKARKQEFSMLTGIDETAHFICMLPKKVDSVEEAHELLRPSRVAKGTIRQGEFFFKPASKTVVKSIEKAIAGGRMPRMTKLEAGSTHYTPCGIKMGQGKRKLYALGCIADSRTGRHDNIILTEWHEVIRNTEVAAPRSMQRRAAYWD